jgi:putative Holliday junction resolvase
MIDLKNSSLHVLMGFDFGMKRIGIAIGQTVTENARPLTTLKADQGLPDWSLLTILIKKWCPDALIVGIPLNMDGSLQPMSQHAKHFAVLLKEKFNLPVFEMDERLTTKAAREHLFNEGGYQALQNGRVDQMAAKLIVEDWIKENKK